MQRFRSHLTAGSPPLRLNDLHIAAHARSEGLTLGTNNIVGFERVPGMLLENWLAERLARQSHRQQVQQAVGHWSALHDAAGSYADGHPTL